MGARHLTAHDFVWMCVASAPINWSYGLKCRGGWTAAIFREIDSVSRHNGIRPVTHIESGLRRGHRVHDRRIVDTMKKFSNEGR